MNTHPDFVDWVQHPVTQDLIKAIKERELVSLEYISNTTKEEFDFFKGYIRAIRDILQTFSKEDE